LSLQYLTASKYNVKEDRKADVNNLAFHIHQVALT